ncbi:hypothetical protein BLL36_28925 [Pseudomonas cedrina subsp. cedrina]|uniref:Uncharacterized protein n=1 Tax=Pseudomonas cedrina subsp. cedrina TaxID=76762 RepID=A0A1V2JWQ8_PSECE|nr:hypothetical protein BLL36_28925 [Pseudomonas cedrina subsp. cedrina]
MKRWGIWYLHNSDVALKPVARELAPVAAFGPTMWLGLAAYISISAVTAAIGSALTASPFKVFDKIPQNSSQGDESDVGRSSSAV